VPCTVASVLVLPAGYNWALGTRLPGSLLMTAGLLVLTGHVVWRRRNARPGALPRSR
jgi:alpha-1,6-mannosyltransferase